MTTPQKRLAFISTMEGEPWGGCEELWSQAALRLLTEGFAVTASVKRWPADPAAIQGLSKAGCVILRRTFPTRVQRLIRKIRPDRQFAWLDETRPDLAIVSQGATYDGLGWMDECRKRGVPYISVAQAAAEFLWPPDSEADAVRTALLNAKICFFVSEANRRLLCTQLAADLPNSKVLRNPFGVPYDVANPWPEANPFRLACVARLDPSAKGQDLLFQVLRQEKWRTRPIKVTLYGNGHHQRLLTSLRDQWELNMVSFGGFRKPSEIWKDEHILVLPSRYEGLPLAVVEAMLCGRPCIVTDVAGNTEVVEDEVTGFVAAAPTVALLDEAMERAWARREEWREMGAASARRIRELVPPDPVGQFVDELRRHLV